jgi:hypothetical protein
VTSNQRDVSPFLLHVDVSSLKRPAQGGLTTGRIAIQVGDHHFPAEGWYDSVIVVMMWMLGAFITMPSRGGGSFQFMEGPCRVTFSNDAGQFRVRATERRLHGTMTIFDLPVDRDRVVRQLLDAATAVSSATAEWDADRDLLHFRDAVRAFSSAIEERGTHEG